MYHSLTLLFFSTVVRAPLHRHRRFSVLSLHVVLDSFESFKIEPGAPETVVKKTSIHKKIMDYIEEEHLEGQEVAQNEAYLHTVKLDKKSRTFGVGDLAKAIGSGPSTSTLHFHSEAICNDLFLQMKQELKEMREERMGHVEQVKKLLKMVETQQQLLEQFMSRPKIDSDLPPPS